MPAKRPKALKWIGDNYGDGRPVNFINDVEPRDYTETETAELTNEQLTSARQSGLYREVHGSDKATKVVKNTAEKDPDHHQAPGSDAEEIEPENVASEESDGN